MFKIPHPGTSAGLAVALTFFLTTPALAQDSRDAQPEGLLRGLPDESPLVVVAPPNVEVYLAEDLARGHKPLRYGAVLGMHLSIEDGLWSVNPDGSRTWHVRIVSPGAKSLAVEFDLFELPRGAQMFVYNPLIETVLGPFTHENHHHDLTFVFDPLPGDDLTLEITVPAGAPDPLLFTSGLIHDYRDVYGLMDGTVPVPYGDDDDDKFYVGGCLIDVNCPQGDAWPDQKRATVRTLSGGSLCSAALLNNTAQDGTQYVLTAHHCGQSSNTTFRFNYQRAGCNSGSAPTGQQVSGAQVLATNSTFDNRFMRITNNIPPSYDPFFAGWTRTTANASFAFALGHPGGGPKKISIDATGTNRENNFWRVTWTEGTLQGGSSGGPLIDQNGRVRGPACCVNNFTCNQTAWFGRFDRFYTNNNLAQWLDPLGTNPTSIDGLNPSSPPCIPDMQNYCGTSPNSAGLGANITAFGSQSIADNDFTLFAIGLPANVNGMFFYGPFQVSIAAFDGVRCVGGQLFRLPITSSDSFGDMIQQLDFTQHPANAGAGEIVPGSDWNFQCWYRDQAFGGTGSNFSDALEVTFCP